MNPLSTEVQKLMAALGATGYTDRIDAKAREVEERIAKQDAENKRLSDLRRMGAPDFLTGQLARRHRTAATDALANIGTGIAILGGDVDTGKSIGALGWLMTAPGPVWYCQSTELAEVASWHKKPWQGKRSLVLDDVGTEDARAIERVQDIVLYAHGRSNCTLVMTTNLTSNDTPDGRQGFKSRYGARVVRRMRERPARGLSPWITVTDRRAR